MESFWPAVARGDVEAPPAIREWATKLETKPKYVVSTTRKPSRGPIPTAFLGTYAPRCRN